MQVAILHGQVLDGAGWDEQDVFVQSAAVSQALVELGYEPVTHALSLNIAETITQLLSIKPAFVFNLVEAIEGKGSLIHVGPVLLESLNIPYTGAQAASMFLTSHKITAKNIMRMHGIATPDCYFHDGSWPEHAAPVQYVIKSAWEHGSVGLDAHVVRPETSTCLLQNKILALQTKIGGQCFAEVFIEGREINVSLLGGSPGPELLPPAEILFTEYPRDKMKILCYQSKWEENSFEYQHTPRTFDFSESDAPLLEAVKGIAQQCWDVFHLRGYARVDFRVDETGKPWVLEVNANPCLSPEGGFAAAAKQQGLSYTQVIKQIVENMPLQHSPDIVS